MSPRVAVLHHPRSFFPLDLLREVADKVIRGPAIGVGDRVFQAGGDLVEGFLAHVTRHC